MNKKNPRDIYNHTWQRSDGKRSCNRHDGTRIEYHISTDVKLHKRIIKQCTHKAEEEGV